MPREISRFQSHGDGKFRKEDFGSIGENVIFEPGVLVFHPENIHLGENIYIGHNSILKGYHRNQMVIGDNTWIGQGVFFHSAGGITIGQAVGIGPHVRILTSVHKEEGRKIPILASEIEFQPVRLDDDCDIGVGAIILPGVTIGRGAQVGAGAVVTRDVEPFSIVAGAPAKLLRMRSTQ